MPPITFFNAHDPRVATQILVDADTCPCEVKEMLYRAAERGQVQVTLVANQVLRTPPSPWVNSVLVPGGMNTLIGESWSWCRLATW